MLVCAIKQACDTMKTPVEQAAARAVTFSVFQLVSSLPNPILLPTTALQELQQMSQAARLASDTNCGWHLLSLAAALQYCQQEGIKVII